MKQNHYARLLLMVILSFVIMYLLMYAMVNRSTDLYGNINKVHMAGLMTAPMVIIELVLMKDMYEKKVLNFFLIGASLAGLVVLFAFIRNQTLIGDQQFLRSMIPHHSSAILMCQKAALTDTEIIQLCKSIIESQQSEINQMNALLNRLRDN